MEAYRNKLTNSSSSTSLSNTMVAVACVKCNLVMLCKSSPSCPNCKYMHSFPSHQQLYHQSPPTKTSDATTTVKSLDTLSLLN
ncbi:hypothetical protein Sjap_011152 [Stephania japonica]|uniref:Uncharacterized protein n=1 Tax=Stephania japonica TaxID=461633 RepID=A0AAP0JCS0_9MAGN